MSARRPASPLRLYRLALLALPRRFRQQHGEAMLEVCSQRLAELPGRNVLARAWHLVLECLDVLRQAVALRLRRRSETSSEPARGAEELGRETMVSGADPAPRQRLGASQAETLLSDLRFSVRSLRRRSGFAAVVMATLVLGIGATTALFTVVEAVLLRPLPYTDAERLVRVWPAHSEQPDNGLGFSIPDWEDWAARATSLSALGLYFELAGGLVSTAGEQPEELSTAYVNASFFDTLAVPPRLGRALRRDDEERAPFVVVLSERAWRARFAADPEIVGKKVVLSDRPFEVIGVMPSSFVFPSADVELWTSFETIRPEEIPLHLRPVRILSAVGRLAPGVTLDDARADLTQVATTLAADYPETNANIDAARVVGLKESMVGDVRATLTLLLAATSLLLWIACVNVAHLMLFRGDARGRELAIRRALGAESGRLVRLVMLESLLLSVASGAIGLVASWGMVRGATVALARVDLSLLPRLEEIQPDFRVALFALGLSLVTGLLFGAWPAIATVFSIAGRRPGRRGLDALRVTGGVSRKGGGSGKALVALEVAMATLLLVGAGLMVRSLGRLIAVDPGFRVDQRLAVSLIIAPSRYEERSEYMGFYNQLLDDLRQLPGVRSVATMKNAPVRGIGEVQSWELPSEHERATGPAHTAGIQPTSPGLFETLGVPLLAGRDFGDSEKAPVILINRGLAREAFDAAPEEAIGRHLLVAGGVEVEVVGVVGDMRSAGLRQPPPNAIYAPLSLLPRRVATYILATDVDPMGLIGPIREVVRRLDPSQALTEIAPFEQLIRDDTAQPRLFTRLLALFALLAAALSAVGIYGVVSVVVGRRLPEMGLRKALGATHPSLAARVIRSALVPITSGAVGGLVLAVFLTQLMASVLFGVRPFDLPTYTVVGLGVVACGVAACLGPALRAAKSDAMTALRVE